MLVHSVASRRESIAAAAPITRISLDDLLAGADGDERAALIALLRESGKVSARVVQTHADGSSVLEFGKWRASVRLAGPHAAGELLLVMLDAAHQPTPSATVSLSRPAALLHDLQKIQYNQILIEDRAIVPLVGSTDTTAHLTQALRHALRVSGLFYESHLQGWLEGRVTLNELREEPQARLMAAATELSGEAGELLPPRLEYLVRQQLDVLARGGIEWRGLVWPDQPAAMAIQAEPQPQADAAATPSWRIHLELDLPALGTVAVDIALSGRTLDLRLQSAAAAASALRRSSTALAATLAAHDLAVGPILVNRGERNADRPGERHGA